MHAEGPSASVGTQRRTSRQSAFLCALGNGGAVAKPSVPVAAVPALGTRSGSASSVAVAVAASASGASASSASASSASASRASASRASASGASVSGASASGALGASSDAAASCEPKLVPKAEYDDGADGMDPELEYADAINHLVEADFENDESDSELDFKLGGTDDLDANVSPDYHTKLIQAQMQQTGQAKGLVPRQPRRIAPGGKWSAEEDQRLRGIVEARGTGGQARELMWSTKRTVVSDRKRSTA